jgi:hypothetical protein
MIPQSIVLGSATLSLVLAGIGVVVFVTCLPVIAASISLQLAQNPTGGDDSTRLMIWTAIATVQIVHMYLLWSSITYLAVSRWIILPVRVLLMPLVMTVARIEAIREGEPTMYLDVSKVRDSEGGLTTKAAEEKVLMSFKKSNRRRYTRMQKVFRGEKMRHKACWSEESLHLASILPIVMEHERRSSHMDGKNFVEEFIKRFLVVIMVPKALLDFYYDENNKLSSVHLTVQQGNVLHGFLYFSSSHVTRSGIWFHGILTNLVRGTRSPSIRYVNGHVHQTESKRFAGLVPAEPTGSAMLQELYPFCFMERPSTAALSVELWTGDGTAQT